MTIKKYLVKYFGKSLSENSIKFQELKPERVILMHEGCKLSLTSRAFMLGDKNQQLATSLEITELPIGVYSV